MSDGKLFSPRRDDSCGPLVSRRDAMRLGAGGLLGTLILMGGATALARRSARRSPPDGAQDTSPPEAASSDAQIDGAEAPQEA